MILHMKTSNQITLKKILLHKDHFDQRLIEIANTLDMEVHTLTSSLSEFKSSNQKYKKANLGLHLKIKDLESQKYTYHKEYLVAKKERDEAWEYYKRIQKEIDELKKENEQQRKEIERQKKDIDKQSIIIDKYKHLNSTNSNMPPSMDILERTRIKAQANAREKTDQKRGGQKCHPLHKSKIVKQVDQIIVKKVKKAPTGAVAHLNEKNEVEYYVTQEVDLILKSVITETRYYIDKNESKLDNEILNQYAINPVTYSANFKATTVYLNQKGTIPLQRLCDIMWEISKGSIQVYPSTISKWCMECHKKSQKYKGKILEDILKESLINVDETGIKINGVQYWIHVLTNEKGSYFLMSKKRGDLEKGPVKLLELYTGILIHDHFSTYQKLQLCLHAECNAHIDRYLKCGRDFDHNEECEKLLELLHKMLRRKNEVIKDGIMSMSENEVTIFEKQYIELLKKGLEKYEEENPNVPKKYEPDYVKTFRRMIIFKEDHMRFIKDFQVPYTNNRAERECRAVKAKKKTSGQFVSECGGEAYVSILSILQTSKLNNKNALEVLADIFH